MSRLASGNGMRTMEAARKQYLPTRIEMVERNCSWCIHESNEKIAWPWWIDEDPEGVIVLRYVSNGSICPEHSALLRENHISHHKQSTIQQI